jgi:dTDP-4-amino-4,6-dideoxygalactose transaminase
MKARVTDLAMFGGSPAFGDPLHVGRPNIGDRGRLSQRINDLLDRRWLTNTGRYVQEFERRIEDLLGVKHCIAMCNGTVALEIAIRALGLKGEVILPSFTFVATAHALQWQEITPVFCDIDPKTHHIDPLLVERMITPRTTGIIGVHLWGKPCDIDRLTEIANRRNLTLIFDAAHAFGCTLNGRYIGNFGRAEVFSFHATKFLNSFEGGAVVTNDDELAKRIRLMQNFGFVDYDHVDYVGTNGKMSEVSAAMGLTSLESMDTFTSVNRDHYLRYRQELSGIPGLDVLCYDETDRSNFQYVVISIDSDLARLSRDQLMELLWEENVRARRYFFPCCHRMEPYRSHFPHAGLLLKQTEWLSQRILCLPTGTALTTGDIEAVCGIIRFALAHAEELLARWSLRNKNDQPSL